MHHLAWCGISIFSSILLTFILRFILSKFTQSQHILTLYDEFAGNLVSAVTVMELSILTYAKHNPIFCIVSLYIFIFIKVLYFSSLELYASPLSFVDLYYAKNRKHPFTVFECFAIIVTQSLGTLIGIGFARQLWVHEDAVHINASEEACLSTLSEAHLWYECFAAEMFGTFICAFVDFNMKVSLKPLTRPLMILFVILGLGHISGTWMNPMLATVFTFRCSGHTSDLLHIVVYWIAPFVGLLLAWELQFVMTSLFSSFKGRKTEGEVSTKKVLPQKKKAKKD